MDQWRETAADVATTGLQYLELQSPPTQNATNLIGFFYSMCLIHNKHIYTDDVMLPIYVHGVPLL